MLKHVESVNDREFTERLLTLVNHTCNPSASVCSGRCKRAPCASQCAAGKLETTPHMLPFLLTGLC